MSAAAPPSHDEVSIELQHNLEAKCCELLVKLEKPGWIIRSVILFSDTIFDGGSFAVHPSESTSALKVPLRSAKSSQETIDIRVLIGAGINAPFFVCHQVPTY